MKTTEMINRATAIAAKINQDVLLNNEERWVEAIQKATAILNAGNGPIMAIGIPALIAQIGGAVMVGKTVSNVSGSKIAGAGAGIGAYTISSSILENTIYKFFAKKMVDQMENLAQEYGVDISDI